MNENLTLRILDYLEQKTNYAVIVTGKYGIGKTYYLENLLFPEIRKIKKHPGNEEKYKTIKISLFGVTSIDEIEKLIFFEAYPILKKKGVQIFGGLLKGAAKFVSIDVEEFFKDSGLTPSEINNYENFVICFDDIDRKSTDLNLSEVYGFINNLVENKSAKVILIANEDTLRKEMNVNDIDNYSILREKVIGVSFSFKPDNLSVINNLIESYQSDAEYFDFLKSQSSYIINLVSIKDDNLRNVIFFLEHFKNVFSQSLKIINQNENLKKIKIDVLTDVLKFTLPIAFEYKLGKLDDKNLNLLIDYFTNKRINWSLFGENTTNHKSDYIDEFAEQYNDEQYRLRFFESILEYVIGNSILEDIKLLNEFQEIYKSESENFSEKELIYSKLRYWDCVDLSSNDYKKTTKNLIRLIDNNKLFLNEYATAFHYITRFDNPLNLKIENIKKKIISKIKSGKYQYVKHLDFHLSIGPSEKYKDDIKEIINASIEKNHEIAKQNELDKLEDIFKSFEEDFDEFIENSQNINNEFVFKPFFAGFNFKKLWKVIGKLKNKQLIELGFLIEYRYRVSIYPDIKIERAFLISLKEKLEKKVEVNKSNKLDISTYKFVINKIESVLPNF
ncbi:hypothetical protein AR438_12970 [Chryseobacterium aquaticum]|uniref:KAP NTPase domain-containing protein n=1 Tax=Chryseobacterium aquaticum TaxID=452084 RepID=A0A0Q3HQJ6_9FLAO|nr:hypothetical protein [Chryseobacterium aquaticum]KQK25040.1 hypothetical protein AR438_12970 [Chryseobacterium aquaticum]